MVTYRVTDGRNDVVKLQDAPSPDLPPASARPLPHPRRHHTPDSLRTGVSATANKAGAADCQGERDRGLFANSRPAGRPTTLVTDVGRPGTHAVSYSRPMGTDRGVTRRTPVAMRSPRGSPRRDRTEPGLWGGTGADRERARMPSPASRSTSRFVAGPSYQEDGARQAARVTLQADAEAQDRLCVANRVSASTTNTLPVIKCTALASQAR